MKESEPITIDSYMNNVKLLVSAVRGHKLSPLATKRLELTDMETKVLIEGRKVCPKFGDQDRSCKQ